LSAPEIRRFAVSPERIFKVWVDPALLQCWLAPIAEAGARIGDHQRIAMTWVYEGLPRYD